MEGLQGLVKVDKTGVGKAAVSLAKAFFDYPLMKYIFPSDNERAHSLPFLFEYYLYYCVRYGEIYATSADMEGVAIWVTSDNYHPGFFRTLRAVPLKVLFNLSSIANERMKRTDGYMEREHLRLLSRPHWYLGTLGVVPENQGKGYASRLLNPMLARIDADGFPCYLETQVEARVKLYEHFGFKVIDTSIIPGTGISNWAMLRETKARPAVPR